jgi:hypothetical protein
VNAIEIFSKSRTGPDPTSHCQGLENTLEVNNPKKEKMTNEKPHPIFEEMPTPTDFGVDGGV